MLLWMVPVLVRPVQLLQGACVSAKVASTKRGEENGEYAMASISSISGNVAGAKVDAPTSIEDDRNLWYESEDLYAGLDANVLDFESLKSLPELAQMKAIQSAKRQSIIVAQQQYRSLHGGPSKFSNVQMGNFIKSAHFNVKVEQHVKSLKPDDSAGKRIEGDDTREYVLTKVTDQGIKSPEKKKHSHTRCYPKPANYNVGLR